MARGGLSGAALGSLFSSYFLLVDMRILGLLYGANEKKLGWF